MSVVEIGFVLHFFGYFSRHKIGKRNTLVVNSGISGYWFEYGFHLICLFPRYVLDIQCLFSLMNSLFYGLLNVKVYFGVFGNIFNHGFWGFTRIFV